MQHKCKIGLEVLLENPQSLAGQRVGLVCNQASVNRHFEHAADLFHGAKDINLTTLFGPQHGIRGDLQDNMIESPHSFDEATGLQVYSLYSETREPTAGMLEDVDVLVIDLQDVGCRIYTFSYTMANCMQAAAKAGKRIVVCDRPNPINGRDVAGNLLEESFASFVGLFPMPVRHGLTIGELAVFFNEHYKIGCDLTLVEMQGWERSQWYDETGAAWVLPSPNMPNLDAATVFPGTVIIEGTQLSEGRGTTRPFEFVGAPYIAATKYADLLNSYKLESVYFRACNFQPTFQKHAGKTCGGVQIHVLERDNFEPVIAGIATVKAALELYPDEFAWKVPPYEYVYDKNPFDVICGTDKVRLNLEKGESLTVFRDWFAADGESFVKLTQPYRIYS